MPRVRAPRKKVSAKKPSTATASEVLDLTEAAKYLRVPEAEVLRLIRISGLPGQRVTLGWRFLRSALQNWLSTPTVPKDPDAAMKAMGGIWKDDPGFLTVMQEVMRENRRPIGEDKK